MAADPNAVLGLPKAASAADLRKAQRRLVPASDPDDDAGRAVRFQAIPAACDLIEDPEVFARRWSGRARSSRPAATGPSSWRSDR